MIYARVVLATILGAASASKDGGVDSSRTRVGKTSLSLKMSETLPGNLLPNFLFMQGAVEGAIGQVVLGGGRGKELPFIPDDSCGDDMFEGANPDLRSPQLPYLTQDLWTCDRKDDTPLDAWTLEDDNLRVTVTPQYAGKVWSIYDKKRQRDVIFNNKAHSPANIAALKAWASGGAEWNWSPGIIGHSAFSETQVYLARVKTKRGQVLRVYEFDRYNGTVWQVDMALTNGSFMAHPRVSNPTDADLRGYWWTCVAVATAQDGSTRVLTPATHLAESSRKPFRHAAWPAYAEGIENSSFTGYTPTADAPSMRRDMSYIGNHQLGDQFLRIPDTVYTPYIGHVASAQDGYTLVHGHPLNGTKFFTWGDSGPGRFMQDFLAGVSGTGQGKRTGDYTELQTGPAPSQMQTFPLPARSKREWTEWFKGFDGNLHKLYDPDYASVLNYVDHWMRDDNAGMPQPRVRDWDAFLSAIASEEPEEILAEGQPWGRLEELRRGRRLAPGLRFSLPSDRSSAAYQEVKPWLELINYDARTDTAAAAAVRGAVGVAAVGTFSAQTLQRLPTSFQTTDAWLTLLQHSADLHGETWLHALHTAVAMIERGAVQEPLELLQRSIALQPTAVAIRTTAILQPTLARAWPFYRQAWDLVRSPSPRNAFADDPNHWRLVLNLATEMAFFLQAALQNPEEDGGNVASWSIERDAFLGEVTALARLQPSEKDSQLPSLESLDAVITLKVRAALAKGAAALDSDHSSSSSSASDAATSITVAKEQYAEARHLLAGHCFPTYAEQRADLMDLWHEQSEGTARTNGGTPAVPLTGAQAHRARRGDPVPENIGCQYASEYCLDYW